MSNISTSEKNHELTLSIEGEFSFSMHRDFRESYKHHPDIRGYTVDLSRATYIDSAGLGMLVQLQQYAGHSHRPVSITGAHDVVAEILQIARFDKLFRIASVN